MLEAQVKVKEAIKADPALAKPLEKISRSLDAASETTRSAVSSIESVAQSATPASLAERLPASADEGPWIVAVSADKDLSIAKNNQPEWKNYEDSRIYWRKQWYRTVIAFNGKDHAENALKAIKVKTPTAYVTNLRQWCPNERRSADGNYQCD